MSVEDANLSRVVTSQASFEGHISLDDHTKLAEEEPQTPLTPATPGNIDGQGSSKLPSLSRVGTGRLREGIARRKYARYQQGRYEDEDVTDEDDRPGPSTRTTTAQSLSEGQQTQTALKGEAESKAKDGRLRRGQQKVRGILKGKKQKLKKEGDSEIDVLWENQRGSFLFGRPYYSSNSLLNFDPPAWTNVYNKPSATDILNATVPDPSWEWVWKTWYVDMSLDCDEQGWQYSFMFQQRFPWHGTHPWFYSFARRRRWIRKRVRKHRHLPDGRVEGGRAMQDAHRLNADYFTIHAPANKSPDSSYPPSTTGAQTLSKDKHGTVEEEPDGVDNIRILIRRLKKATVDREKINLVLNFMDDGGQDVHYLAEEMPHIMSMFMYQYSQRQLLASMLHKVDARSSDHREEGKAKEKAAPDGDLKKETSEHGDEVQYRQDLGKAVEAADRLVKELEYWSDIKSMVQSGQSLTATDEAHGWGKDWQGLDNSGPVPAAAPDASNQR